MARLGYPFEVMPQGRHEGRPLRVHDQSVGVDLCARPSLCWMHVDYLTVTSIVELEL